MKERKEPGKALIAEIARYLAAIDLFRAEGSEPTWRAEPTLSLAVARKP